MSSSTQFTRRPYTGSCHCGHIKYIVYLSLPTLPYPKTTSAEYRKASGHRIYKCNCTICHKVGIFHIRPLDAANDFFVTSPTNPFTEGSGMQLYRPHGTGPWDFCGTCGVRAFSMRGTGYVDEVELPTAVLQRLNSRTLKGTAGDITAKEGETTRVKVWRPSRDWQEHSDEDDTGDNYLSINAHCLDAHNENFDLNQLHEKGYVSYVETLLETGGDFQDTPYFGGTY